MTSMSAARLLAVGEPLRLEELEKPTPGPDEVLLRVEACGLCGTDLHLAVEGSIPIERFPITLGHEASGTVVELGPGVEPDPGFRVGGRVAMFPAAFCGTCSFCEQGRQSLCKRASVYGMARDGALADFVCVPLRTLVALPEEVPFDQGAIATDSVATPLHALRSRGRLQPGESVAIFGCGGLGTHAIQLARLLGAGKIVAVDLDAHARERALGLGADFALDPREGPVYRAIRELLAGGADLTLEFVGIPETVDQAIRSLATGGRAVVVGVGPGRAQLPPLATFVAREQTVMGSFGMDLDDIAQVFEWVANGRLDLSQSISARYPLAQAHEALARLASKDEGVVRVVVQP